MENLDPQNLELAPFSARVVAFSVDLAVFFFGYAFSTLVVFPGDFVTASMRAWFWIPAWMALFILYQSFFSASGRRSLGKALVGLRVVDGETRKPLSLDLALARSVLYLLSSVFDLGFLWCLFQRRRQCWHDMVVDSVVVDERERSPLRVGLLRAGAFASMTLVAGGWLWNAGARERYQGTMEVAYAQTGLDEMKTLEKLYYYDHGRFTDDLKALADQSGQPQTFLRDVDALFADVKITAGADGYNIEARANDDAKTLVALNGP